MRELYETGLEQIAQEALAVKWRDDAQKTLAHKAFALADGHGLTWAYEDLVGNIVALDDAPAIGNAIVILMTPFQAARRSALLTHTSTSPPQIMIGPHLISRRWGGIALGHELIHVHDVLEGIEPLEPTEDEWFAGEARAFRWEAQLVDALSGGSFGDQVAGAAVAHPITATSPATEIREVATALRTSTFEPPASHTEQAQQDAFCAVAALFSRRGALWSPSGAHDDLTDLRTVLRMP